MKETAHNKGSYFIQAVDDNGRVVWEKSFSNTLTSISQKIRSAMLMGDTSGYSFNDLDIQYIGFGTGTTPPSPSDTQLQTEVLRKQVTKKQIISDGLVQTVVSLSTSEGNFGIQEIGVFCGPSATIEFNTGILLSRVVTPIPKNSNLTLNIVRNDVTTI